MNLALFDMVVGQLSHEFPAIDGFALLMAVVGIADQLGESNQHELHRRCQEALSAVPAANVESTLVVA